jgi:hypothetical protein
VRDRARCAMTVALGAAIRGRRAPPSARGARPRSSARRKGRSRHSQAAEASRNGQGFAAGENALEDLEHRTRARMRVDQREPGRGRVGASCASASTERSITAPRSRSRWAGLWILAVAAALTTRSRRERPTGKRASTGVPATSRDRPIGVLDASRSRGSSAPGTPRAHCSSVFASASRCTVPEAPARLTDMPVNVSRSDIVSARPGPARRPSRRPRAPPAHDGRHAGLFGEKLRRSV